MALSWLNLLCALTAAFGVGKRTLDDPASLPRHRGCVAATHGPNGAVADSLDEAAFGAAGPVTRSRRRRRFSGLRLARICDGLFGVPHF
jgi:hypothetical protein